jgi:hypothetical protein
VVWQGDPAWGLLSHEEGAGRDEQAVAADR